MTQKYFFSDLDITTPPIFHYFFSGEGGRERNLRIRTYIFIQGYGGQPVALSINFFFYRAQKNDAPLPKKTS